MKLNYKLNDGKILISMARGDEIISVLEKIAESEKVYSGLVSGIGAMEKVRVGYYDIKTKTYVDRNFNGEYELTGLTGNITLKDSHTFVHSHVTFSDENFQVFGGHLFEGYISAAGEFIIIPAKTKIHRRLDENIGLALWDLET